MVPWEKRGMVGGGRVVLPLHPDPWTLLLTFCSPQLNRPTPYAPTDQHVPPPGHGPHPNTHAAGAWARHCSIRHGGAPSARLTCVPGSGHTQVLRPGPWGCLDLPVQGPPRPLLSSDLPWPPCRGTRFSRSPGYHSRGLPERHRLMLCGPGACWKRGRLDAPARVQPHSRPRSRPGPYSPGYVTRDPGASVSSSVRQVQCAAQTKCVTRVQWEIRQGQLLLLVSCPCQRLTTKAFLHPCLPGP